MFLLGTIVNTVTILFGSALGMIFHRMPSQIKTTVMSGIALFVAVLGIGMSMPGAASGDALYIVAAVVLGGALGAWLKLEERLNGAGRWIEGKIGTRGGGVAEGFVFASLVFGVGSMSILGALQSGLTNQNSILFTKAALDGFSALLFTSTMGPGVALSAIPIFFYEGGIATLAHFFGAHLQSTVILRDVTAVGGLLIVGIAFNMLFEKRIQVANLLPAMVVVAVLRYAGAHVPGLLVFHL